MYSLESVTPGLIQGPCLILILCHMWNKLMKGAFRRLISSGESVSGSLSRLSLMRSDDATFERFSTTGQTAPTCVRHTRRFENIALNLIRQMSLGVAHPLAVAVRPPGI